jgi:uncharacterized protein YaaN involved in tellurite resistance
MTDESPTKTADPKVIASVEMLPAVRPDAAIVAKIKSELSLDDRAGISTYGDRAQRDVTSFADRILSQTQNRELGDTGKLLTDIIGKAQGLDPASLAKKSFFSRFFGNARAEVTKFKSQFENVSSQIDAIAIELDKRKDALKRDIAMLDGLHDQTADSISKLASYIEAGKVFAEDMKATLLPELKAKADAAVAAGDGMIEAQEYRDAEQALDRLEKRVFYLQQARQIGIQQLPQIRIVQSSDETLIESLQASTRLTIPLWKQKMVLLLGLARQEEALGMQKAVTDATNQMLRQTSEMMKGQAIAIEEQSQKGIVDIETLEKTNLDLIETMRGVLTAQEQGRIKRVQVEQRMDELTGELKRALIAGPSG